MLLGDKTAIQRPLRKNPQLAAVADRLFTWLKPRLKPTLTLDDAATKQEIGAAVDAVPDVYAEYSVGQTLAKAGVPLEQMGLLSLEHKEANRQRRRPAGRMVARGWP